MGKFWSGKILANLANGRPFAKIFPANSFNMPNQIPEKIITMAGLHAKVF